MALIDLSTESFCYPDAPTLINGRAHLQELGINALELLPPADSYVEREWGYATSNYLAADYDLGFSEDYSWPAATTELVELICLCHKKGMRFFYDAVMAFATKGAYRTINYKDFHVKWNSGDPEQGNRDPFGGDLFKYNYWSDGYDPITGTSGNWCPARQFMMAHIAHWILFYHIDGIRMDSVNNIMNYDFMEEFKNYSRRLWNLRHQNDSDGNDEKHPDECFLVIGESIPMHMDMISQNRLDSLWNEHFKNIVRQVILGENADNEASFEGSVQKLIDCRCLGFKDGAEAINYIGSHDVEGYRSERLYNYLVSNGVTETEERIKLAFVCLLTAVGIPMILAGDEFADEHDLVTRHPEKQVDPVNYYRMQDSWRQRIFEYVSRLVKLRTTNPALAVNDTKFLHSDFEEGKKVVVWQRGGDESANKVIVVANFSDWGTYEPESPY